LPSFLTQFITSRNSSVSGTVENLQTPLPRVIFKLYNELKTTICLSGAFTLQYEKPGSLGRQISCIGRELKTIKFVIKHNFRLNLGIIFLFMNSKKLNEVVFSFMTQRNTEVIAFSIQKIAKGIVNVIIVKNERRKPVLFIERYQSESFLFLSEDCVPSGHQL
jgi:hypothetical protein